MIRTGITRYIHTNSFLWQESTKSLLGKLRNQTGYTFTNCKKALEENGNDYEKALAWLKDQAQAQGWAQAEKMKNRNTYQGIIAMTVEKNHGVLVEINCETDFVARNSVFHGLADIVLSSILNHSKTLENKEPIEKTLLSSDALKELLAPDGKSLADHSALTIGLIKENINIRRALCMTIEPGTLLFGRTHPAPVEPIPISYGKYGVLTAMKCNPDKDNNLLGQQLCEHIIGMKPQKIGDITKDVPVGYMEYESCLLFQEFLFDSTISIQEYLKEEEAEILEFARFEMGEEDEVEQPLTRVETSG